LDPQTLEQLRLRGVAAVLKGHSPELVIQILGLSRCCIYVWLKLYESGGWEALRPRPIPGRGSELHAAGKEWLKQTVLESTPEDWGFDTQLWTRAILADLLEQRFGIQLSETTVGRYLHEFNLSPQVPDFQAQEKDPEAVRFFLEEKFPQIAALARKMGATIYFGDESGCRANEHWGRTWGVVGERPVLTSTGQRYGLNMISAISPEGQLRFKVFEKSIGSAEVIEFLQALLQESDRPIIALLDNHRIHFSAAVRDFARPRRQRLKLFSLPTYSPECNPDEGVWNEVKPHGVGRQGIRSKADLKEKVYQALYRLQKQTEKIFGFFRRTDECAIISEIELAMSGYL